jgi:hypothetical protein
MSMLKADGYGWRARIGVLTHADQTMSESEFWTMAPDGVSIETQRVPFSDYRTYADPPGPDDATEVLAKLRPQVIVYGFTAAGYLYGAAGEQALIDRLQQHSQGIPVIMPCMSAVAGFRALQARRIALFHPRTPATWMTTGARTLRVKASKSFRCVISRLRPQFRIQTTVTSCLRTRCTAGYIRTRPATLTAFSLPATGGERLE